jgi:DeoR/GlpR family transcriptional regulator of sugar metabolism
MLAAERRDFLLTRLHTDGKLVAKDVAAELGIAEDSIRRDLRELAAAGLCQRVYGGALPVSPAAADYATRTTVAASSKQRVAAAAVNLIRPGSTVLLDGGTTALAVARAVPAFPVTIVTHSVTVAAALVDHPTAEVLVLGGRLFKHSAVTCGAATAEAANQVRADLFLLGVTGVHHEAGLTTGDADEAAMKRTLAAQSAETYVLASTEKVGTASPFTVLPPTAVSGIITDAPPTHPVLTELRKLGATIVEA